MKKEIREYISDYIISKDANEIINSSDIINSEGFDIWSFKKLIFLEYYLKPFLQIAINNLNCNCLFIDLFSSAGANTTTEIKSIGSPIISILKGVIKNKKRNRNDKFYKWFFIEKEKRFCGALKRRVEKAIRIVNKEYNEKLELGKDIRILYGDCNVKINDILKELKEKFSSNKVCVLAFVDPYKFTDLEWKTLENLASTKYLDIIFTFPIQTIERGYKGCQNLEKYLSPSTINLLKKHKEISKIPKSEFESAYAKDLRDLLKRSISHYKVGISVKNLNNREIYRITLFTHSKKIVNICLNKATELDNLNASHLKKIVEQVLGKQKSIGEFIKK